MPSSAVRTFTDPGDYAAAIRQGTVEVTVTRPGDFTAQLTRIDLHRLWMQRFSENLPRVSHVAGWGGRAVIAFQTHPGPTLLRGGVQMEPGNIVRHVEGQSYHHLSSGFASYGSMSLPVSDMVNLGASVAGCDLTPPKDVLTLTPPPAGQAPAAARGCRAVGGRRPRGDCPSRGGARSRTGVDRGHGRVSRLRRGSRGQVGAAEARVDPAPVSPGGGGKSRSSALHPGALYGDRSVGPDIAGMLPGAAGDEPQPIPAVAPDAFGAASLARECSCHDYRDRDRGAVRLLAVRPVRRRIQVALR